MAKVALYGRDGRLLDRQTRANQRPRADGIARLDAAATEQWLIAALARYAGAPIEMIVPVAHGAGVAVLRGGALACAPLDYEAEPPAEVLADYRRRRDAYAITGSPALPGGLNIGAQLHWLEHDDPPALDGATLLPWAQYWAWWLSGVAVSEVTSLGCHSDLWAPATGDFSPMAKTRGWAERFAPMARAADAIGTLRPEIAAATGLPADTRILAGLHDSNAALLAGRAAPELAGEATVLSTGTWFIAMRSTDAPPAILPERKDCLTNVDIAGRPVPTARFMGGREIELLGERIDHDGLDGLDAALAIGAMVLPGIVPGCGPFPAAPGGWINRPDDPHARAAAIALYAALMADVALDLIGARGALLIEGRFAASAVFTRALASLRPNTKIYATGEADVAYGALRLIDPALPAPASPAQVAPRAQDLAAYRARWHEAVAAFT